MKKPRGQVAGKSSLWERQGWTVSKGSQILPEIMWLAATWEGRLGEERLHIYASEYQKWEQKTTDMDEQYAIKTENALLF